MNIVTYIFIGLIVIGTLFNAISIISCCRLSGKISQAEGSKDNINNGKNLK